MKDLSQSEIDNITRKKKMKMETFRVPFTVSVSGQRIQDLLCSAFEGGSNYWIRHLVEHNTKELGFEFFHECVIHPEGKILFVEQDHCDGENVLELNRAKVASGLKVMAEKYPYHFENFMNENDDAETGDVFLQCCVFGDVVYG